MEPKGGSSAVVTAEAVREALARRPDLSAVEENVVRMRHGARAADLKAPLPQAHGGREDLKDELLLLELRLLRGFRRFKASQANGQTHAALASARADVEVDGKAKDKIVRALRKKR
ncbi:MAG TPA: hypothetical protein VND93_33280 [Myxococcales bacterium]|nr:hypothetical protein [Myxococcales bacterium]